MEQDPSLDSTGVRMALGVGIVGSGFIARFHVLAFQHGVLPRPPRPLEFCPQA